MTLCSRRRQRNGSECDATTPLDSEMLGLEEDMNENVVDIRPERFLRAMRETGDWNASCKAAGLDSADAANLCNTNAQFDRSMVECLKENLEEKAIVEREAAIAAAHGFFAKKIGILNDKIEADFNERHPELMKEAAND